MGPITLLQADFNLGEANIVATGRLQEKVHAQILKLGFKETATRSFRCYALLGIAISHMLRLTTILQGGRGRGEGQM